MRKGRDSIKRKGIEEQKLSEEGQIEAVKGGEEGQEEDGRRVAEGRDETRAFWGQRSEEFFRLRMIFQEFSLRLLTRLYC